MKIEITSIEEVTIEWITEVLRRNKYLENEFVTDLKKTAKQPSWKSTHTKLEVKYSNSNISLPSSYFLKLSKPNILELDPERGWENEVEFYRHLHSKSQDKSLLTCYNASYSAKNNCGHLLLEDLSESHFQTIYPLPPKIDDCKSAIKCLAKHHSNWWAHQIFDQKPQGFPNSVCTSDEFITDYFDGISHELENFIDFLSDRLLEDRKEILEKSVLELPRLLKKRMSKSGTLTLAHGDAIFWNFLYPKNGTQKTKIIDWENCRVSFGMEDISSLIARYWFPEYRKKYEKMLVKYYHDKLLEFGIINFTWDDCWNDYRLGVILAQTIPLFFWLRDPNDQDWWHHLEIITSSFKDLNCMELLA